MSEKSANGILSTTIEKVRDLVDVSTIIGEPINLPDGLTIIPISKVTYGFASGGSDFPSKNNVELFGGLAYPFAGFLSSLCAINIIVGACIVHSINKLKK